MMLKPRRRERAMLEVGSDDGFERATASMPLWTALQIVVLEFDEDVLWDDNPQRSAQK
jgi:hypothetical protein